MCGQLDFFCPETIYYEILNWFFESVVSIFSPVTANLISYLIL